MVYFLIRITSLIFFKLYLGFRVYGRKNIPKKGAFILAANHASYLDPLLLAASFHRTLYFITRDKVLKAGLIGWILKYANTIPVKRHGRDMKAIKDALSVLSRGRALAVFPEGTRSKNREFKKAKPGIGFLASKANVPVVPAYIEGSFDAQPRGIKTLKRHPVKVYIGKPIDFSGEFAKSHNAELYQNISDGIMRHIAALKNKIEIGGEK